MTETTPEKPIYIEKNSVASRIFVSSAEFYNTCANQSLIAIHCKNSPINISPIGITNTAFTIFCKNRFGK